MQSSATQFERQSRPGFTLVELLVVICIITLLASMILVALAGVQDIRVSIARDLKSRGSIR